MKVIEQKRSARRLLEGSDVAICGPREGAALVTEELAVLEVALELASGVRGERPLAEALRVDQFGKSGFPATRGPDQDERRECACVRIHASHHVHHRRRLGDEIGEERVAALQRQAATTLREPRSQPQQVDQI